MNLLILMTVIGICTAYNQYRTQRDVIDIPGKYHTSYGGYDYPRPLPDIQPPKINLLYLPVEPVEPVLQPLPSETRPKYVGTGNYIFEIQADETDKSHVVDVENPHFRNTIHFVQ